MKVVMGPVDILDPEELAADLAFVRSLATLPPPRVTQPDATARARALAQEWRYSPDQPRDDHGRFGEDANSADVALASRIEAGIEKQGYAKVYPNLEAAQTAPGADEDGSAWLFPSGKAAGLPPGWTHENALMQVPLFKDAFWASKPDGPTEITQFATELGLVRVGGADSFEIGKINDNQLAQLEQSFFRGQYTEAAHVDIWVGKELSSINVAKEDIVEKGLGRAIRDALKGGARGTSTADYMERLPSALRWAPLQPARRYSPDQPRDDAGRFGEGAYDPLTEAALDKYVGVAGPNSKMAPAEVALMAKAIDAHGVKAPELFRGAVEKGDAQQVLDKYATMRLAAQPLAMGVRSFTSDATVAETYIGGTGDKETGVIFHVAAGGRGLDLGARAERVVPGYGAQAEWLTKGQFQVRSEALHPADSTVHVYLKQLSTEVTTELRFEPDQPRDSTGKWSLAGDEGIASIKSYLTAVSGMMGDRPSIPRFVLEHGKQFVTQKKPPQYQQGPVKMCYMNAANLVMQNPRLKYAEGYVSVPGLRGLPLEHAWAVGPNGKVIDNTLKDSEKNSYFGVEFKSSELLPWLVETGVYGVFSNTPQNVQRVIEAGGIPKAKRSIKTGGIEFRTFAPAREPREVRYSPDQPRDDHGRFGEGEGDGSLPVGPIESTLLRGIQSRAEAFFAAGGRIEIMQPATYRFGAMQPAPDGSGPERLKDSIAAGTKTELANQSDNITQDQVHGLEYMARAIGDDTRAVVIAHDAKGEPVAAVSFKQGVDAIAVELVGSSREMKGAATAVELEVARYAAGLGVPVNSVYEPNSRGFHEKMGRVLDKYGPTSDWDVERLKQLAALPVQHVVARSLPAGQPKFEGLDSDELAAFFHVHRLAGRLEVRYSPDQERDELGRFGSGHSPDYVSNAEAYDLLAGLLGPTREALARDAEGMKELAALPPGAIPSMPLMAKLLPSHVNEIMTGLSPREGQPLWHDPQPVAADEGYTVDRDDPHPEAQQATLDKQEAGFLAHLEAGGGEKAAVIDRDGKAVFTSTGTKDAIEFTERDMALIKAVTSKDDEVIGTHSHPSMEVNGVRLGGNGFSPPDIGTASQMGLREMRVVTESWTYAFRALNAPLNMTDWNERIMPIGQRAQREYMSPANMRTKNAFQIEDQGWHHIYAAVARAYPLHYAYHRYPTKGSR